MESSSESTSVLEPELQSQSHTVSADEYASEELPDTHMMISEGKAHILQAEYAKLGIRDIHDLIESRDGYCKACTAAGVPAKEMEVIEPKNFRDILDHAKRKHPNLLPHGLRE